MKVLIPTNHKDMNGDISPSFGRATYFLIYDTETHQKMYVENPGASSTGGAGVVAAQKVIDSGAHVVITYRLGKNAYDIISESVIHIYKPKNEDIKNTLKSLSNNELNLLTEFHAGFHMHR